MKLYLVAVIWSCALLSVSYASIIRPDQSLVQEAEEPQDVDLQLGGEKHISLVAPTPRPLIDSIDIQDTTPRPLPKTSEKQAAHELIDIQESTPRPHLEVNVEHASLKDTPEAEGKSKPLVMTNKDIDIQESTPRPLLKPTVEHAIIEDTPEAEGKVEAISETNLQKSSRAPKQLIGFIPSYVIRNALRMVQEPQYKNVQMISFDDDYDDNLSSEIEEERAVRRRKRYRRRNKKGHLKKSRRHKNTNKRKLNSRRKVNSSRRTQLKRGRVQKPKKKKKKSRN